MQTYIKDILDYNYKNRCNLTEREYNNIDKIRNVYISRNINIDKTPIVIDIGASEKFMSHMNNISPTLKASRCNYYVTNIKRKLNINELLMLQGFPNKFKQVVSD